MTESALERRARLAKSPAMRELAMIGLKRGLNQHRLAAALDIENPSNLGRYFKVARPRRETLAEYARRLQLNERYLQLVDGNPPLSDEELEDAEILLFDELRDFEHSFKPKTRAAVRSFLYRPGSKRSELLTRYMLAKYRTDAGLRETPKGAWASFTPAIAEFAAAAGSTLNLLAYIRTKLTRSESFLLDLYLMLSDRLDFEHPDALALLDSVRMNLRLRGIAYTDMDAYLMADYRYRGGEFQWRGVLNTIKRSRERRKGATNV